MVLSSDDVHGLVLISDTMEATGSAVMGHLTKLAISSDPKLDVVIVSSHYASSSYAASLRRAGLQASSLFSSGRIKVIEVPRLARERKGHAINLKSLSRLIYEVLSASKAVGRSVCVVFDDLTVLKCSAASRCVDWVPFLHYSVRNSCLGLADSVIALVHRDIDEDIRWIGSLEHDASTVIDISSIEGDFMRARLRIKRKRPPKAKAMSKEYVLGVQETLFSLNSWPLVTQI